MQPIQFFARTPVECSPDGSHLIDWEGDPLKTLMNCEGYYACPTNAEGKLLGPVVGYTASYAPGKNWVGLAYYNFAMADKWPAVLAHFARFMASKFDERRLFPNIILGAPWAGVKFSQEVARIIGCRHIFAEKKTVRFDENGKAIEELVLGRYEGEIYRGAKVIIGEELVNNTSTTGKLVEMVTAAGGTTQAIICTINRSSPVKSFYWDATLNSTIPIIGVIERETPQYQHENPMVAAAIASGNVVWKPKYAWARLKAAMDAQVA